MRFRPDASDGSELVVEPHSAYYSATAKVAEGSLRELERWIEPVDVPRASRVSIAAVDTGFIPVDSPVLNIHTGILCVFSVKGTRFNLTLTDP